MPSTMLLRKLEQVLALTKAERQTIEELPEHVLHLQRSEDVLNGSRPTSVHLLRTGIAGRYTLLGEGQRQITAFLVPGDCCDLRALLMGDMDHSLAAFASCDMAVVPHQRLFAAIEKHPMRRTRSLCARATSVHAAAPLSPAMNSRRFSGRDASCLAPPAQIRTCGFPACGSHLGCLTATACRMRSSACDTRAWL